ncbi:hypothetical protein EJ08DRAFT_528825 [Tothia fuscella]|uniref:Uncharacterized protein n=1 Tax=Tothia fuscella TaxID=1048955 RepID=A0A9P4NGZ9_9PEZI|nr:hypothetical protein EJ08DRAFT_528825 [Tothia fuscella]
MLSIHRRSRETSKECIAVFKITPINQLFPSHVEPPKEYQSPTSNIFLFSFLYAASLDRIILFSTLIRNQQSSKSFHNLTPSSNHLDEHSPISLLSTPGLFLSLIYSLCLAGSQSVQQSEHSWRNHYILLLAFLLRVLLTSLDRYGLRRLSQYINQSEEEAKIRTRLILILLTVAEPSPLV